VKGTTTTLFKGYAYAWLTLAFFLGSLILHWWFGWRAFLEEAAEHGQSAAFGPYAIQMLRGTFRELAIGVAAASVASRWARLFPLPGIPEQATRMTTGWRRKSMPSLSGWQRERDHRPTPQPFHASSVRTQANRRKGRARRVAQQRKARARL